MPKETKDHTVAAQDTVDLLRVYLHRMTAEQREMIGFELLRNITDAIKQFSVYELQHLAQFIDVLKNDHGCTSPAERMICGLVSDHYLSRGLTPERIAEELDHDNGDGFVVAYNDLMETVGRYNDAYSPDSAVEARA